MLPRHWGVYWWNVHNVRNMYLYDVNATVYGIWKCDRELKIG